MSNWKLYCIIDSEVIRGNDPVKLADHLFRNGADIIQLRFKNLPSYVLVRLAKTIRRVAAFHKKTLVINDRIDVALASDAHGVHLGSGDFAQGSVLRLLKKKSLIGATVHFVREARNASSKPISYIGAGPVFATPLKRGLKQAGVEFVKRVKKVSRVPVFAIGGINKRNIRDVFESGADGICVARSIFQIKAIKKELLRAGSQ
ncbi:MAG: thiamine phosphate synthase [Candidatus Omnitrophota bacterium]